MIEPTESESKEELDLFIDAMRSIAEEVEEDPQYVLGAPHNTRVGRMDEVSAARKPVLRWRPQAAHRKADWKTAGFLSQLRISDLAIAAG